MTGQTILILGDSFILNSGLSIQCRNLMRILQDMGYKVLYCSITGPNHDKMDNAIYMGNSVKKFDELIEAYRPVAVVCLHDLWVLMTTMLTQYRNTFTLIGYLPVESDFYPETVLYNMPDSQNIQLVPIGECARKFDYIIAYCDFGARGLRSMGVNPRAVIGNGLDRRRTYIIDNKEVLSTRRKLIGVNDDDVLFLHVSRNSTRKRQDVLLESMAKFVKMHMETFGSKPRAKLYMHTEPYGFNGFDLPAITRRLGIQEYVIMPKDLTLSDDDLNVFYNACDIYISTVGREGWGLGHFESAAVKKPQIYGCYGGFQEHFKAGAAGIEVPGAGWLSAQNIDAPTIVINSKKTAEAMMTMYLDPDLRKKYGEKAYEIASEFYWDKLDHKFKKCFEEAILEGSTKRSNIFAKKVI